jgi:hypothetical protein
MFGVDQAINLLKRNAVMIESITLVFVSQKYVLGGSSVIQ